jgi:hypothetical protein
MMNKRQLKARNEHLMMRPLCRVCLVADKVQAATNVINSDGELHSVCDDHVIAVADDD